MHEKKQDVIANDLQYGHFAIASLCNSFVMEDVPWQNGQGWNVRRYVRVGVGFEMSDSKWTFKEEPDQTTTWADRLGICLSGLCLIHCLLTPIVLVLLPTVQVLAIHEELHHWLLVTLPVIAILAFVPGFRRHKNSKIFYWALPGFALLVTSHFFEESLLVATAFSVLGSACLIRAHFLNRHLCACCASHPMKLRPNSVLVRNRFNPPKN